MHERSNRARRWAPRALVAGALAGVTVASLALPVAAASPDDRTPPLVTLGSARVVEGDAGRSTAKVPITLTAPLDGDAWYLVETLPDQKAAEPGLDYKPVSKRVRIKAGQTAKIVQIPIYGDTEPEGDEVIELSLRRLDAPALAFGRRGGAVVVVDDDSEPSDAPRVSVDSEMLFEGGPGKFKVPVKFTLSEPQDSDVFVTWHTEADTATPGEDYKQVARKVTRIRAGRTQKVARVTILGDDLAEEHEGFRVVIDGVSGAPGLVVGVGEGQVLLADDDTDTDGDGLPDTSEILYKTDPNDPDTDRDRIVDYFEIAFGTNPFLSDTDADGLDDLLELKVYGTDPLVDDTDGDGHLDGAELAAGTDPLDPSDPAPRV